MAVSINILSDLELRSALAFVPGLPGVVADRMLVLRPFADAADCRRRVNEQAANAKQHLGLKLLAHFDFKGSSLARTRNAHYARELLALPISVPWSAWDGYDDGSGYEIGMVWDYNPHSRRFTVHFQAVGLAAICSCCSASLESVGLANRYLFASSVIMSRVRGNPSSRASDRLLCENRGSKISHVRTGSCGGKARD